MGKGIAVAAIWLGPALACWATGDPKVAVAFFLSCFATIIVFATEVP